MVYFMPRLSEPSDVTIVLAQRDPTAHRVRFDLTTVDRSPSKGLANEAASNTVGRGGRGIVWKKSHAVNVRSSQVRLDLVVSIYYLVCKSVVI